MAALSDSPLARVVELRHLRGGVWCACLALFALAMAGGQEGTASLTGAVVDNGGAAIPSVAVVLLGQETPEAHADGTGRFEMHSLRPGSYTLKLKFAGFQTRWYRVNLQEGQIAEVGPITMQVLPGACEGQWVPALINQERIAEDTDPRLSGFVWGAFNMPNVFIVLHEAGKSEVTASTRADKLGEFQFRDLAPGTYIVEVSHDGKTYLGTNHLTLQKGFDVELSMGWGTGLCFQPQ